MNAKYFIDTLYKIAQEIEAPATVEEILTQPEEASIVEQIVAKPKEESLVETINVSDKFDGTKFKESRKRPKELTRRDYSERMIT